MTSVAVTTRRRSPRRWIGTWRVEHLFTLKQARELYRTMPRLVAECDAQIEAHLPSLADRPAPPTGPDLPPARKKPRRNGRVAFDAQPLLEHQAGVDLTRMDGIDTNTALTVLGEIGLDMSRWPTEKHFASWLAPVFPPAKTVPTTANRPVAAKAAAPAPVPTAPPPRCGWRPKDGTAPQPRSARTSAA